MNLDLGTCRERSGLRRARSARGGFVDQRRCQMIWPCAHGGLARGRGCREDAGRSRRAGYRRGGGGGGDAGRLRVFAADESAANLVRVAIRGRWRFHGGGRSCRFRPSLEEAARVITGARGGRRSTCPGACAGPWRRPRRPALPARRPQRRPRYSTACRGPHCRGRGGEPPYRRPWGRCCCARLRINGTGGDAPAEASPCGGECSSRVAAPVRRQGLNILTHCNAGSLATAFYGTALGVVYAAAQEGLITASMPTRRAR